MSLTEAIILGVVQGLTEFLPVSSSGHLVLLQRIFGIAEPALLFDTMLHGGTLLAVLVVLWPDIWGLLRRPIQPLTGFLVLGTIPAVAAALVFKDRIEGAFASGAFLGAAFLITAGLLTLSHGLARRPGLIRGRQEMGWLDALFIGVLQALAMVPGVSRSGSTLSAALTRKLDREFAARFSFLLSIPAILGALVLQLKDLAGEGGMEAAAGNIGALPFIVGTLAAAAVGFFSIRFMLRIIRKRSLLGFAAYTSALGLLVLADQFFIHLFF
ncbi:MAG: undecaprenyl-diphosphate phosphatase [Treponema sp.]|jgi:undecaprenyl-diphosphatase|nr:undecaprenyl-diphosphate phosphatase [Treponema sp.]